MLAVFEEGHRRTTVITTKPTQFSRLKLRLKFNLSDNYRKHESNQSFEEQTAKLMLLQFFFL